MSAGLPQMQTNPLNGSPCSGPSPSLDLSYESLLHLPDGARPFQVQNRDTGSPQTCSCLWVSAQETALFSARFLGASSLPSLTSNSESQLLCALIWTSFPPLTPTGLIQHHQFSSQQSFQQLPYGVPARPPIIHPQNCRQTYLCKVKMIRSHTFTLVHLL